MSSAIRQIADISLEPDFTPGFYAFLLGPFLAIKALKIGV